MTFSRGIFIAIDIWYIELNPCSPSLSAQSGSESWPCVANHAKQYSRLNYSKGQNAARTSVERVCNNLLKAGGCSFLHSDLCGVRYDGESHGRRPWKSPQRGRSSLERGPWKRLGSERRRS